MAIVCLIWPTAFAQTLDLKALEVTSSLSLGSNSIQVSFTNLSGTTADSIRISYEVNETAIASEWWTGTLASGDTGTYTFSTTYNVPKGRIYNVFFDLTLPPSKSDLTASNDTTSKDFFLPMAGHYTVDSSGAGDFLSIEIAARNARWCDRGDSVFIDVKPGVYEAGIGISAAGGFQHWAIFQSSTGIASDVVIHARSLGGRKCIIRDITVYAKPWTATNFYWGKGTVVEHAQNVMIDGCVFMGSKTFPHHFGLTLIDNDTLSIMNSQFLGFDHAIVNREDPIFVSIHKHYRFEGNRFDSCDVGIYLKGRYNGLHDSTIFRGNTFNNCDWPLKDAGTSLFKQFSIDHNEVNNCHRGFQLSNGSDGRIYNNEIYSNSTPVSLGSNCEDIKVYNNFLICPLLGNEVVEGERMHFNYAVYVSGTEDVSIYNNSCVGGFNVGSGNVNFNIYNNIFYSENDLYVRYSSNTAYNGHHNNFFAKDKYIFRTRNDFYYSVKDFNAAKGKESWATTHFPFFKSTYEDLHANAYLMNNLGLPDSTLKEDIDHESRDSLNPDLGADEYDVQPGAIDAGVAALYTPDSVCEGMHILYYKLTNHQGDTLKDVLIDLAANDSVIGNYLFSGVLAPGFSIDSLVLDTIYLSPSYTSLKCWTSYPNGSPDTLNHNDTAETSLLVFPNPIVDLGADTTVCGDTIPYLLPPHFANYLWSDGSVTNSLFVHQPDTIWVTVTDTNGCTASDTGIIEQFGAYPVANLGNDTVLCEGDSLQLTDTLNTGATYRWLKNGILLDTLNHFLMARDSGRYEVYITICDSTVSDTFQLSYLPYPEPDLGPDSSFCSGDTLLLYPGSFAAYLWSNQSTDSNVLASSGGSYVVVVENEIGCASVDSIDLVEHQVTVDLGPDTIICSYDSLLLNAGPGNFTYNWSTNDTVDAVWVNQTGNYWVVKTDTLGCQEMDSLVLSHAIPSPDLGPDTTICANDTLVLDPGGFQGYLWNNGSTLAQFNANSAGVVHVTVTDQFGCEATDSIDITSIQPPSVSLGSDTTLCFEDSLVLDPGAYTSYLWNTGSSLSQIAAMQAGTYWVKVSDTTQCYNTDSLVVTKFAVPDPALGNDTAFCQGDSIHLVASQGWASYQWNTGDSVANIVIDSVGTYTIEVFSTSGCYGVDTILIGEHANPVIELGNDTTVCKGTSLMLSAGANYSTYQWNTTATTASINVLDSGNYSVVVTDQYGCKGGDSIHVGLNPLPQISLGTDTSICSGDSVVVRAPAGYQGYLWNQSSTTDSIVVYSTGLYQVTVTDLNGCKGSDDKVVIVHPKPNVNLGPDTSICTGDTLLLDAGAGNMTYSWHNGSPDRRFKAVTAGMKYVEVIDGNQCAGHDTIIISLNPLPVVDLGGDRDICPEDSLVLDAGVGHANYLWHDLSKWSTHLVKSSGVKHVTVTDINGCQASDSVSISIFTPIVPTITVNHTQLQSSHAQSFQWYRNGGALAGATDSLLQAAQNGSYYVVVNDINGCRAESDSVFIGYVGVSGHDTGKLLLYPNPSEGQVVLERSRNNASAYQVFDERGRMVHQGILTERKSIIDLSSLVNGLYYLQVEGHTLRMIKKSL